MRKMVTFEVRVPVEEGVKPEHVRDICQNHLYFAQWECGSGNIFWHEIRCWKAKVEEPPQ